MTTHAKAGNSASQAAAEYKSLHDVPTDELAGRVVSALIMCKGNVNKWDMTITALITGLRAAPVPPAPQAAVAIDWRTILNTELATQEQHYGEVAAAAATGNRMYAGERDCTEGGIEYCIAALNLVTIPAPMPADLTDEQILAELSKTFHPPHEPGNELLQRVFPPNLVKAVRTILAATRSQA